MTSKATATKQESQVTREEVERQLEMKQMSQPDFMNINVSYHPPEDIFNHDSSNQDWFVDPSNPLIDVLNY